MIQTLAAPKFCMTCGSRLVEQARFCTGCGSKVLSVAAMPETAAPEAPLDQVEMAAPVFIEAEPSQPPALPVVKKGVGFWRRFGAAFIDLLLLTVVGYPLTYLHPVAAFFLAMLFLYTPYFIGLECMWSGQTVGKRIFKLRAVNLDGGPLSIKQAAVRFVVRMICFIILGAAFILGFLIGGLAAIYYVKTGTPTPWDLRAKTKVVRADQTPYPSQ